MRILWIISLHLLFLPLISVSSRAIEQHIRPIVQTGHTDRINAIAFSPDGRFIATGSKDSTVIVWEAASGAAVAQFGPHSGQDGVQALAFSPDGRRLLSGAAEASLLEIASGKELDHFAGAKSVSSVAFAPDGRSALTIDLLDGHSCNSVARLWDTTTGQNMRKFKTACALSSKVGMFSPDGAYIMTADGSWPIMTGLTLWDAASGNEIRRFQQSNFKSAALSRDGRYLALGMSDGSVIVLDAKMGEQVQKLRLGSNEISSVAFSPDGANLFGATTNGVPMVEVATGNIIRTFGGCCATYVMASSPDGRLLATSSNDETDVILWDTATGKEVQRLRGRPEVAAVAFSQLDKYLLVGMSNRQSQSADESSSAILWDTSSGMEFRRLLHGQGALQQLVSAQFSADGKLVLTASPRGVRVWDIATGAEVHHFGIADEEENFQKLFINIQSAALSPDGKYVAAGSKNEGENYRPQGMGGTIHLWDSATGSEVRAIGKSEADILTYSTEGKYILSANSAPLGAEATLWEGATGNALKSFNYRGLWDQNDFLSIKAAAISADGQNVLTGEVGGNSILWDVGTAKQVGRFEGHTGTVNSIAFSKDSKTILTGSDDGTARLWDRKSGNLCKEHCGEEARRFQGHLAGVTSAAYSSDGRFIVTGSKDGMAKLWSTSNSHEIATLFSATRGDWVVVEPDGRYDASRPDNPPLHWVTDDLRIVEASQLKRSYYTAGLLSRLLKGEVLPEVVEDIHLLPAPPIAAFTDKAFDFAARKLQIKLTNEGGGVGHVLVSVNSKLVQTIEHLPSPNIGQFVTVTADLSSVNFRAGENTVTARVFDSSNVSEGHVATFTIQKQQRGQLLAQMEDSIGVNQAAISSDGNFIATVRPERLVVWDITSQRVALAKHFDHNDAIGVAFSPDEKSLYVSFRRNEEIEELRTVDGQLLKRIFNASPGMLFISPDGRYLASGSAIVDLQTGSWLPIRLTDADECWFTKNASKYKLYTISQPPPLAFSSDTQTLAFLTRDGVSLYDLKQERMVKEIQLKTQCASSVAFLQNDTVLAVGAEDGINEIDLQNVRALRRLPTPFPVSNLTVIDNQDSILAGLFVPFTSRSGSAMVFSTRADLNSISFGDDMNGGELPSLMQPSMLLAARNTNSSPGSVPIAILGTQAFLSRCTVSRPSTCQPFDEATQGLKYARFSPGRNVVLGAFGEEFHAFRWSATATANGVVLVHRRDIIKEIPCGNNEIIGTGENSVNAYSLVDVDHATVSASNFPVDSKDAVRLACTSDGNFIASISEHGHVSVWPVEHPERSSTLNVGNLDGQFAFLDDALSDGARSIAIVGVKNPLLGCLPCVALYDVVSGRKKFPKNVSEALTTPFAFSKDGRLFAAADVTQEGMRTGAIVLLNTNDGLPVRSVTGFREFGTWPTALAFSPDSKRLATAIQDGTIRIQDVFSSQNQILRSPEHGGDVRQLEYSTNGKWLLVTRRYEVDLWNTDDARIAATLMIFNDGSWAVTDPEGRYDGPTADNSIGLHFAGSIGTTGSGLRVLLFNQLRNNPFYTPNLLQRILKEEELPNAPDLDHIAAPPLVSIQDRGFDPTTHKLGVRVTNDGGGVGLILIRINNRLIQTLPHPIAPLPGESAAISVDLSAAPFMAGKNTIAVSATDFREQTQSQAAIASYDFTSDAQLK